MSTCSIEPANQICYIVKPPKPLGAAIDDFIKEQIKTKETAHGQQGATVNIASASAAPLPRINSIGQITGRVINTTA
jgi:hypothetical protein